MARIQHAYIRSREDFLVVLAELTRETGVLETSNPDYPLFGSLRRQLEAIAQWSANGRNPTPDERRSLNIGVVLAREFDQPPRELKRWAARLSELNFYVLHWRDDASWNAMDDEDDNLYFPLDD